MSKASKRRRALLSQATGAAGDQAELAIANALSTLATSLVSKRSGLAGRVAESAVADYEFADRREYLPNGFGFDPGFGSNFLSSLDDRRDGRNAPFIEDELDVDAVRGLARLVTTVNCPGVGIVENLKNYIVGKGFSFKATKKKRRAVPEGLLDAVQDVIDNYLDDNDFLGDLDRELLLRARRDGEFFLAHFPRPGGRCALRVVEPEAVRDPGGTIDMEALALRGIRPTCAVDFSFGILTPAHDVNEPLGYSVCWRQEEGYDVLPASHVIHHKLNVDRNVKRGLSDFYPAWRWLRQQEKLLRNTGEGAAELAAIAYIIQYATATSTQVNSMVESSPGYNTMVRSASGTTPIHKTERPAGSKLNVPKGQEYLPGPMGADRGQSFLEVVGGILRQIAVRWCMVEGMVSGDDSQNNHASMIEAGGRFYSYVDASQFTIGRQYYKSVWIALKIAYDAGVFARFGLTWEEFVYAVDVRVTPPAIGKADSYEQEQVREIRKREGVLTVERWKEEVGYDSDEAGDGSIAELGSATATVGENGEPLENAAGAVDIAKQALNGAQVASLLQLLSSAALQQLPLDSVKAMIGASFPSLTLEQISAMVEPIESFIPAPEGATLTQPAGEAGTAPEPGSAAAAAAATPGVDYSDKSRLQFKRNAGSIMETVKKLQAGELTKTMATELLGMLGMPPDRIERLVADATDNGKLDDEESIKATAESLASECSPWWALQYGAEIFVKDYP